MDSLKLHDEVLSDKSKAAPMGGLFSGPALALRAAWCALYGPSFVLGTISRCNRCLAPARRTHGLRRTSGIGHAPYAAPLLEYLANSFTEVHVVAIQNKLFPSLSEDCWLLCADGYGGSTSRIGFTGEITYPSLRNGRAIA
jgi:hypothetical protein